MRNRRIKRKRIGSINVPSVWVDSDDKVSGTITTTTNDGNDYCLRIITGYDISGRPIKKCLEERDTLGAIYKTNNGFYNRSIIGGE